MRGSEAFARLVAIMERLRGPDGCPWDREQTPASIAPYCLEEAYEVVDAIDEGIPEKLRDELGDLLLQVVFHAQMAKEAGSFDIDGVIGSISEKLVRRHPHVFRRAEGDEATTPEEVLTRWSEIKKKEGREHLFDGIPKALPALLRATRMGEKASSVGFDWKNPAGVVEKLDEELREFKAALPDRDRLEDEFGDLLFTLANLARHLKVDPETALRKATEKFDRRFRKMELAARAEGRELNTMTPEELERLWERAKSVRA